METKTIKISKENYYWLLNIASELQKKNKRLISFDETLSELKDRKIYNKKKKLSDLAGSWNISVNEADKIKKELKNGWNKWKIQSV